MNSKKILNTLVKIAGNQQKILAKLAQSQQDQNIAYLKRVAETAVLNVNAGVPVTVQVELSPAQKSQDPNVKIDAGYTVYVTGFKDDNSKNKFKANLDNTLKAQNSTLADNLSVVYK